MLLKKRGNKKREITVIGRAAKEEGGGKTGPWQKGVLPNPKPLGLEKENKSLKENG